MGGLTTDVPTLRWYAWLTGRAAMLVPVNVRCGSQQKVPRHTAMVLMTWQRPLLVAKLFFFGNGSGTLPPIYSASSLHSHPLSAPFPSSLKFAAYHSWRATVSVCKVRWRVWRKPRLSSILAHGRSWNRNFSELGLFWGGIPSFIKLLRREVIRVIHDALPMWH
jgi:hypothetical protein